MRKTKPGPQPTHTEAKSKAILRCLTVDGLNLGQSCKKVGVGIHSYYRRIDAYPEILSDIKSALDAQKRVIKEEALQTIRDAMKSDWKAAAWYLERRFPNEYGRRAPVEAEQQTVIIRNELGPKPRYAMDLTDDPEAKN